MIVNLRGANGSGKSTVAHELIKKSKDKAVMILAEYKTPQGKLRYIEGTWLKDIRIVIVGKYKTQCGGCDGIPTQDLVCEAVRFARSFCPNVLFEGVIVSTIFSRYAALAHELGASRFAFAYLDTPLKKCLQRIQKRNGGKAIKEELVAAKVRAIEATKEKVSDEGLLAYEVDHRDAVNIVHRLLKQRIA